MVEAVGAGLSGQASLSIATERWRSAARASGLDGLRHGRFLQVAGLRFSYHVAADGKSSVAAADVSVRAAGETQFAPLALDRRYRAATLTYTWRNGYRDGYPLFSAGNGATSPSLVAEPTISWRQLTEEALAALPGQRIATDLDGRIARIEAPAE